LVTLTGLRRSPRAKGIAPPVAEQAVRRIFRQEWVLGPPFRLSHQRVAVSDARDDVELSDITATMLTYSVIK
jgi:hypothetical protein